MTSAESRFGSVNHALIAKFYFGPINHALIAESRFGPEGAIVVEDRRGLIGGGCNELHTERAP